MVLSLSYSKGKVEKANYSKNMAYCSKNIANCSKNMMVLPLNYSKDTTENGLAAPVFF